MLDSLAISLKADLVLACETGALELGGKEVSEKLENALKDVSACKAVHCRRLEKRYKLSALEADNVVRPVLTVQLDAVAYPPPVHPVPACHIIPYLGLQRPSNHCVTSKVIAQKKAEQ